MIKQIKNQQTDNIHQNFSLRALPISEASRRCVLHNTWSMGVRVPSFSPLFWILTMLAILDKRITDMVHANVFTVAGPFPVLSWSNILIASSLNGPIFTIKSNATAPSAISTRNSNWIISLTTIFHETLTPFLENWLFFRSANSSHLSIEFFWFDFETLSNPRFPLGEKNRNFLTQFSKRSDFERNPLL